MRIVKIVCVACGLALLAGCSLYRIDRQFVWDSEYEGVRDLYDECGSVAVIEKVLRDMQWTRGQINEVRYRLAKDYSFDADGFPRGIDRPRSVAVEQGPVGLGIGPDARKRQRWAEDRD